MIVARSAGWSSVRPGVRHAQPDRGDAGLDRVDVLPVDVALGRRQVQVARDRPVRAFDAEPAEQPGRPDVDGHEVELAVDVVETQVVDADHPPAVDVHDLLVEEVRPQEDLVRPLLEAGDVDRVTRQQRARRVEPGDLRPGQEDPAAVGRHDEPGDGRIAVADGDDQVVDLAQRLAGGVEHGPADGVAQVEHGGHLASGSTRRRWRDPRGSRSAVRRRDGPVSWSGRRARRRWDWDRRPRGCAGLGCGVERPWTQGPRRSRSVVRRSGGGQRHDAVRDQGPARHRDRWRPPETPSRWDHRDVRARLEGPDETPVLDGPSMAVPTTSATGASGGGSIFRQVRRRRPADPHGRPARDRPAAVDRARARRRRPRRGGARRAPRHGPRDRRTPGRLARPRDAHPDDRRRDEARVAGRRVDHPDAP